MADSQITNAQNASTAGSTCAFTTGLLDFEVLKAFEKVKSDDGSDILIELIDLYIQGTSQHITVMRKAADDGEQTLLKRAAHTLKGSSSILGLPQMAKACQDIEEASSSYVSNNVHKLIGLLESKFRDLKPVLIAERNRRLEVLTSGERPSMNSHDPTPCLDV